MRSGSALSWMMRRPLAASFVQRAIGGMMRGIDGDSEWLVRLHHWLVFAFLLGGTAACLMM